jgi:hypothetical protein
MTLRRSAMSLVTDYLTERRVAFEVVPVASTRWR